MGDVKSEQEIKLLQIAKAKSHMYESMFHIDSEERVVPGKLERLIDAIQKSSLSPWRISGNRRSMCSF